MKHVQCKCGHTAYGIPSFIDKYKCPNCERVWQWYRKSDIWMLVYEPASAFEKRLIQDVATLTTVDRHLGHIKGELKHATSETDIDRLLDEMIEMEGAK